MFIIGIGGKLGDGEPHDMRAPDYDDYSTLSDEGLPGLNGDLLVWNEVLGRSLELSSMGIRVDKEALERQLKESGHEDRRSLYFHQRLLDGTPSFECGRWHRTEPFVHVLSAKGAHRRNPSLHLARRYATILQRNGHSLDLNVKNSQKIYQY